MKKIALSFSVVFLFLMLASCDQEISELPTDIDTSGKNPVLYSIDPPDSNLAGIGTMTLVGENFVPKQPYNAFNHVFFDEVKANVLSATETELVIRTPTLIRDSIHVKIATSEAELIVDSVFYSLKFAVEPFGSFLEDDIGFGLAMDPDGNLYISIVGGASNVIKRIAPDGTTSEITTTSFTGSNTMRYGPGDAVYAAYAGRVSGIRKIIPADEQEQPFVTLDGQANGMDFDDNDNLWVVRRSTRAALVPSTIERIDQAGNKQAFEEYDYIFTAARVYDGYLYFAGKTEDNTEHKIWRRQINGDGTLGADELVLDEAAAPVLLEFTINEITFSASDIMFLATDHSPDAIYTYDLNSEELEVFYPDLIMPEVIAMTYGPGEYMYVSRQGANGAFQLFIVNTQMEGAPYPGRE